ncbi:MAG: hypothetical protein KAJ19_12625 [Gammaproteobacteria bacterium]|nr:hypothetical protein [Gammaproteobacteria bacterium]
MVESIITDHPPLRQDGLGWCCQCARCGWTLDWEYCDGCDDEGLSHHDCGEDTCCCKHPEDNVPCDWCNSEGGRWTCMSDREWCKENPLPGRESMRSGQVEWFVVPVPIEGEP